MLGFFKKISSSGPEPKLAPSEKELKVIHLYANGDESLKEDAIKIFYKHIKVRHEYIEFQFMSEIVSNNPDLALQIIYRANVREKLG